MKTLLIISIAILCSCTSQLEIIHEDTLYVTRKYVGDFADLGVDKRTTRIITTEAVFHLTGTPTLNIPPNAKCYVKYIPERMAGATSKYWVLYFTWDGTEDLFMLKQNWITGKIY